MSDMQISIIADFPDKQDKLSEKFAPGGKYPFIESGEHLMQLLKDFYGPWALLEIQQQQQYLRGELTPQVIEAQLKDIDSFIADADSVNDGAAEQAFLMLPFGGQDKPEFIYHRFKQNYYSKTPLWRSALIADGKQFDKLTIENHTQFIEVYARYFLYKEYLKSLQILNVDVVPASKKTKGLKYKGVALMHKLIVEHEKDESKKITKTNAETIANQFDFPSGAELLKACAEVEIPELSLATAHHSFIIAYYDQLCVIAPLLENESPSAFTAAKKQIQNLKKQHGYLSKRK